MKLSDDFDEEYSKLVEQFPLNNCPFCGHSAKYVLAYPYTFFTEKGILGGLWISCNQCFCELGRGGWDSQEIDNGCFDSIEEAQAAWNKRS